MLFYVRRKSKRTFGQTDGGYLATAWDFARGGSSVSGVAICTALRPSFVWETTKAERAIGIYSSLFAEQVLGLSLSGGGGRGDNLLGGVELHQLGQVELGLLQDLDLADEHVLKGEDLRAFLLDLLANLVGDPIIIIKREGWLTAS